MAPKSAKDCVRLRAAAATRSSGATSSMARPLSGCTGRALGTLLVIMAASSTAVAFCGASTTMYVQPSVQGGVESEPAYLKNCCLLSLSISVLTISTASTRPAPSRGGSWPRNCARNALGVALGACSKSTDTTATARDAETCIRCISSGKRRPSTRCSDGAWKWNCWSWKSSPSSVRPPERQLSWTPWPVLTIVAAASSYAVSSVPVAATAAARGMSMGDCCPPKAAA
mmetsp:Transcript_9057/g.29913  ORF Transcript_9057/g.29913 Transcript_9057/m.29913 type:complete len:228 (+) Transcript_9057:84-767(+)